MHLGYFTLLLLCLNAFAIAHDNVRARNLDSDPVENSVDSARRYLKGTEDTLTPTDAVTDEERALGFTKVKPLFSKTPNLSKLKTTLGKRVDLTKMKPFSGDKVDLSKLKTASGKNLDLSTIKSRSMTEGQISKMKSFAEKDPDLHRLSSVVGKNPTQLSGEQVRAAQTFVSKHPEEGLGIIEMAIGGAFAIFMLILTGVMITTVASFDWSNPKG
ncbi:hypothetical protein PRIC1_011673 [Phytophthora ramorum]